MSENKTSFGAGAEAVFQEADAQIAVCDRTQALKVLEQVLFDPSKPAGLNDNDLLFTKDGINPEWQSTYEAACAQIQGSTTLNAIASKMVELDPKFAAAIVAQHEKETAVDASSSILEERLRNWRETLGPRTGASPAVEN